MPFEQFDRSKLRLKPLSQRIHDIERSCFIFPDSPREPFEHPALLALAERIVTGAGHGRSIIFSCAAGVRLGVPVTVHVAIGQDIIHEHPNFDGAAVGATTYTDFLIFTRSVAGLEGGAFLNLGTAVMGPEVYLKALSMARNVAAQHGEEIRHFVTVVFDMQKLSGNLTSEAPKTDPTYYFRPYKTVLVRTIVDGGTSYYVQGDHAATIPALYDQIVGRADS